MAWRCLALAVGVVLVGITLVYLTLPRPNNLYFQGLIGDKPWSIYKIDINRADPQPVLVILDGQEPDVRNGRIIFVRWDYDWGNGNVWIREGKTERPLTANPPGMLVAYPKWSPNGKMIAFDSATVGDPQSGIEVMNADGTGRRLLTNDTCHSLPTWVNDDELLLRTIRYDRDDDGYYLAFWGFSQMNIYSGEVTFLQGDLDPNFFDVDARSGNIVYSQPGPPEHPSNGEIFILFEGNQEATRLDKSGSQPAWSPEGDRIALDHYGEQTYLEVIDHYGQTINFFTVPGWASRSAWDK